MGLRARRHLPLKTVRKYCICSTVLFAALSLWHYGGLNRFTVHKTLTRVRYGVRTPVRQSCDESTRYAYILKSSTDVKRRPRPNHWFHFLEYHLPVEWIDKEQTGEHLSGLVLVLPQRSWVGELTPMTRFFLAAAYLKPSVWQLNNTETDDAMPRFCDVIFTSYENLRFQTGSNRVRSVSTDEFHLISRKRSWSVSMNQKLEERFVVNHAEKYITTRLDIMNITASLISAPKVDSGTGFGRTTSPVREWFPTTQSVQAMRQTFRTLCEPIATSDEQSDATGDGGSVIDVLATRWDTLTDIERGHEPCTYINNVGSPRLMTENGHLKAVIYQRNVDRMFIEFDKLESDVARALGPNWTMSVVIHDDATPPCLLLKCLKDTNLFITPHGFQSMMTMFLPVDAYMFEVFPSGYFWTGYKALSLAFGVHHIWAHSLPVSYLGRTIAAFYTIEDCMKIYFCRYLARKENILVNDHSLRILDDLSHDDKKFHRKKASVTSHRRSGQSLISCVAYCERDKTCFSIQLTQDCVMFRDAVFEYN